MFSCFIMAFLIILLLFFIVLSFTAKLPNGQFVMQRGLQLGCLQQNYWTRVEDASWKDASHRVNPHLTYLPFFFLVRTFTFYSLSKFQLYDIMLSTTVTMLYIRFSDLIHFTTESLYSRSNLSLFLPPIQMLISSRNTLTDPPKIMYNQIAGHSCRHQVVT